MSFYAPFLEHIFSPFPDSQPCSQGMRLLCLWHLEKWHYLTWHLLLNLQFTHLLKKLPSIYWVPSAVVCGWSTKINTQYLPQGVHRLENWFSIFPAVIAAFRNLIKAQYIRGQYLLSTYYIPGSVANASKVAYFILKYLWDSCYSLHVQIKKQMPAWNDTGLILVGTRTSSQAMQT